jgi:hypothetical protein
MGRRQHRPASHDQVKPSACAVAAMTWTKLGDELLDDMRLLNLQRSDRWLYAEGLLFANRTLSNGVLDRRLIGRFTDADEPLVAAARLVDAELWEDIAVGWLIVDFEETQRTRDEVEKTREKSHLRTTRSRKHRAGDHSLCLQGFCSAATRAATGEAGRAVSPRSPDQSSPDRKGRRDGRSTRVAAKAAPTQPKEEPAILGYTKDLLGRNYVMQVSSKWVDGEGDPDYERHWGNALHWELLAEGWGVIIELSSYPDDPDKVQHFSLDIDDALLETWSDEKWREVTSVWPAEFDVGGQGRWDAGNWFCSEGIASDQLLFALPRLLAKLDYPDSPFNGYRP